MRDWADGDELPAAVRATTAVTCHEDATFDAAARCASMLRAALRGAPPEDILEAGEVGPLRADARAPMAAPAVASAAVPAMPGASGDRP